MSDLRDERIAHSGIHKSSSELGEVLYVMIASISFLQTMCPVEMAVL